MEVQQGNIEQNPYLENLIWLLNNENFFTAKSPIKIKW